jgi:hypothetical protein
MDDQAAKIIAGLREQAGQLQAEVEQLRAEVERLRGENHQLREQLEQAQRIAARQAAPFRRRERRKVAEDARKRPGRKSGHAGSCRPCPPQIDETHEVPLTCCPQCGGGVEGVSRVEQIIEEIPPQRPRAFRIITYCGTCPCCGEVRSHHPLQTSHAQGAAKVQLGPRALAIAVLLNKHLGLTMRKTCRVLGDLLGLSLTPGGLSQAADRVADRLAGAYEALITDLRGGPAVNADETSWWLGGPGAWLWVFATPRETVYRVERSRASGVVREVLGDDYAGVLGSDCLSSYDPIDCRKHKCIAHHLRAIGKAEKLPGQEDPSYLRQWKLLFKTVIVVHRLAVEGDLEPAELAKRRERLESWADDLLARPRGQPGDISVQNRLRKQRKHLLVCLHDLSAEPTNNRAERALRPAVIARKLSCGNKTDRGRQTWQVLASLAQTCRQRGEDFLDLVSHRMTLQPQAG